MNVIDYSKKCSSLFTIARVFALISIVAAHISFPASAPYTLEKIYSLIASIGVIAFLFMSAYYYNPQKFSSLGAVIKTKLVSIGIPWLFLGSITYLYNGILSGTIHPLGLLKWILGYKTYLYFLTILFFCFVIFYKANRLFCVCCIPVTIMSLMLTALGFMDSIIDFLHITNYLNILNWIGIFAFGQLCRTFDTKKIYEFIYKFRLLLILIFILAGAVIFVFDIPTGYFSIIGIYFEIIGVLCIFGVSTFNIFNINLFQNIANNSFAIYLIHMPVIGVIDRIYNINIVTQILSSILVVALAHLALEIFRFVIRKIKCEKLFNPLFGFRNRKLN